MRKLHRLSILLPLLLTPLFAFASAGSEPLNLHLTNDALGFMAIGVFTIAYALVMAEEFTSLRKSKPLVIAAGVIWTLIGWYCASHDLPHAAEIAIRHNFLEFAELFFFLLVAMTYISAMEERNVFEALRCWLVSKNLSFRTLFWLTGILAFFISPIADNLTTALLMCAVILAVGGDNKKFVSLGCINVVVAANAGGAFSPFGDITTLMVWQKGLVEFQTFFKLFVPSVVSYVIPAMCMHFAVPDLQPDPSHETIPMRIGAKRIICLFLLTIITAVCFHNFLHLPPVMGMMTGMGYLQIFAYYLRYTERSIAEKNGGNRMYLFDFFKKVQRAEWDTLFFFYGVIMAVGGLAALGYLSLISNTIYNEWGATLSAMHKATPANISVGVFSAILDNIPVMFAVLTMKPIMSQGQWLLVTLTAGIGGSMLSIGSAAGVALMGQAKGQYTFFGHIKWIWAIALGYIAAIATHLLVNARMF